MLLLFLFHDKNCFDKDNHQLPPPPPPPPPETELASNVPLIILLYSHTLNNFGSLALLLPAMKPDKNLETERERKRRELAGGGGGDTDRERTYFATLLAN